MTGAFGLKWLEVGYGNRDDIAGTNPDAFGAGD